MPSPGRSRAARRSSSIASPKRMKRPPLQVPTATCPGSATPRVYDRSGGARREVQVVVGALGRVQRLVGAADELLGGLAVDREQGEAEADAQAVGEDAVAPQL